jgi:hypothetical protein
MTDIYIYYILGFLLIILCIVFLGKKFANKNNLNEEQTVLNNDNIEIDSKENYKNKAFEIMLAILIVIISIILYFFLLFDFPYFPFIIILTALICKLLRVKFKYINALYIAAQILLVLLLIVLIQLGVCLFSF